MNFTAKTSDFKNGYTTTITDGKNVFFSKWGANSEIIDFFSYDGISDENDFCFSSGRAFATDEKQIIVSSVEISGCEEAAKYISEIAAQMNNRFNAEISGELVEEEFDY